MPTAMKEPASARLSSIRSLHAKPPGCSGCALAQTGHGYVPADGPVNAPILFLGETPWIDELIRGIPFAGVSGAMLHKILRRMNLDRSWFRFDNVARCAPPNMWFGGAPWEREAAQHCRQYTDQTLNEGHQVVVPLGLTALKHVLGVTGKNVRVENFHGTVTRDPLDRFWVVPTYHPSHLQRGAANLIGTFAWDLERAMEVARHGWQPDILSLALDPPVDWFDRWVDTYCAAVERDPLDIWLAIDIETPEKKGRDEDTLGPLTPELLADKVAYDRSFRIDRVNFSCNPDEGVTVPNEGPYKRGIARLCASRGVKIMWKETYDWPRLEANAYPVHGEIWDMMEAWHILQSDLPMGLGFVAPFYSKVGAWKHLSESDPVRYAGIDGPQELRSAFGIVPEMMANGQWPIFERHMLKLRRQALQPAHLVGIRINRERLADYNAELTVKAQEHLQAVQASIPQALLPLTPKAGLSRPPAPEQLHTKARTHTIRGKAKKDQPDPLKAELYATAKIVERLSIREVYVCKSCGGIDVGRRHNCRAGVSGAHADVPPQLSFEPATVRRWYWQEPFNPDSPDQILAYIKYQGHFPGRAKKTGHESADREALQRLEKQTKDPFYSHILKYRAVQKVRGTYVIGVQKRLDAEDRIHPIPTNKPSTMRMSYVSPNIQNVTAGRTGQEGAKSLAEGFRRCVEASPGCRLLEVDFGGSEAVDLGWFMRDPDFIRLAKLGVHAGVASHVLGRPYDRRLLLENPAELGRYFKSIKESEPIIYDKSKRVVHGSAYGLTPYGMAMIYPDLFPSVAAAEKVQRIYFEMAPNVPDYQRAVQRFAADHGYLGGPGEPPFGHPFGYKHRFYAVYQYKRLTTAQVMRIQVKYRRLGKPAPIVEINGIWYRQDLGEDAKRVVAFNPQSCTSGKLKEVLLETHDPDAPTYVGDAYYGRTCLRAPIHDSGLWEIPVGVWDRTVEKILMAFARPRVEMPCPAEWGMGAYLATGIEAKASATAGNWAEMTKIEVPMFAGLPAVVGVAADRVYVPADDEDDEDVAALEEVA